MIKTITSHDFVNDIIALRPDNFARESLYALFDYLDEMYDGCGPGIEFDPIAICCEFSEYDSALEAAKDCGYEEGVDLEQHGSVDLLEVEELEEEQAHKWLEDHTIVIDVPDSSKIIIQQF